MRKRGVPIDPHVREGGAFLGRLSMCEYDDPVLRRRVRKVDLTTRECGLAVPSLPRLFDVTLVTLGEDRSMLAGLERLPVDGGRYADYAQSWWVQLRSFHIT
jgi:hypothetical protein